MSVFSYFNIFHFLAYARRIPERQSPTDPDETFISERHKDQLLEKENRIVLDSKGMMYVYIYERRKKKRGSSESRRMNFSGHGESAACIPSYVHRFHAIEVPKY